jgi:hypothetical protein
LTTEEINLKALSDKAVGEIEEQLNLKMADVDLNGQLKKK